MTPIEGRYVNLPSPVTPDALISLIETKLGNNPHYHTKLFELCLLLGSDLRARFKGETTIHTFTTNPDLGEFDPNKLGAHIEDGIPIVNYGGKKYKPEDPNSHIINVDGGANGTFQFIILSPGDVHDFSSGRTLSLSLPVTSACSPEYRATDYIAVFDFNR